MECVFVPFILATVPPIKVRRVLHLAVYLEVLHFAVYFLSVQLEPTGVTQEGVNTGAFFFFLFSFFAPPSSCGACLHFYREKGPAVPFPRQRC